MFYLGVHGWQEKLQQINLLQQQIVSKKTKNIKMMLQHHLDHSLERDGCSSCHVFSCLKIKKQ
jgi:hypothetical protein